MIFASNSELRLSKTVEMGLVVFVAGTLILTVFIAWATYRSTQMLQQVEVDFNLLLLPARPLADIAIGLGVGVAMQIPLNVLTDWAIGRFGPQIYSPLVIRSILPRSRDEWAPVLLALFPAVLVEELLFRSLLLGGLSLFFPIPALVIGTALLFGWMHSPQGRLGIFVTAAISLLLAGLFLWRESLLPPLITHYVVNLLQLLVAHRHRDRL
jgi:membrane protease YdiL (CAAX protease family)